MPNLFTSNLVTVQRWVGLFRDADGVDDDNIEYTGAGDESEYINELQFYPEVGGAPGGYTRKSVQFLIQSINNGVVTMINNSDIVWTNLGSQTWPAPNYVGFANASLPIVGDTSYEFNRFVYVGLDPTLVKETAPGGDYTIPVGSMTLRFA